jgi:hypothetical protein
VGPALGLSKSVDGVRACGIWGGMPHYLELKEPERILASELPPASYLRPLLDVLLDARPVLGALGEAA